MATANRVDPTRLAGIRRLFIGAVRLVYGRLRREINELIVKYDALGLKRDRDGWIIHNDYTDKVSWRFETNPNKIKRFREWLRDKMDSTLHGSKLIEEYIRQSYTKGAERSYRDVLGSKLIQRLTSIEGQGLINEQERQALRSSFSDRATVDKVNLLVSRTYQEMEGINIQMGTKMGRVLADGLVKGSVLNDIASQLVREVGITENKAITIVRTEMVRAHAEGQLDAMEKLGVDEVGIMVEWDTSDDGRVCKLCQPMEGVVLKIKEARGMLPRHVNCRCVFLPAKLVRGGKGKKREEGQKTARREVQRAIKRSQKAEGGSDWGPNKDIERRDRLS